MRTQVLERAFKDETAGLVTRADFIRKRQTIAQRMEADQIKRKRVAEDALDKVTCSPLHAAAKPWAPVISFGLQCAALQAEWTSELAAVCRLVRRPGARMRARPRRPSCPSTRAVMRTTLTYRWVVWTRRRSWRPAAQPHV